MRRHRILGIVALLVWGQLAIDIYPLPFQRDEQIRTMASDAMSSQKYLTSKGVIESGATEEDWIEGLRASFWKNWIQNLTFLILGITVALWAFSGRRGWGVAIILLSGFMGYLTISPIVAMMLQSESLAHWFDVWRIVTEKRFASGEGVLRYLALLYWMFVWPLFHIGLVVAAVGIWIGTVRKSRDPNVASA